MDQSHSRPSNTGPADAGPSKPITTADEVFELFGQFINFEQKQKQTIREYRLDRMHRLLSLFDDPHLALRVVHIAGSKGKGSTALYAAAALETMGEKTGLYSSPHITDYRERITFAGRFVPDELIIRAGNSILDTMEEMEEIGLYGSEQATTFELLTLLAFIVFREAGCSYAVIETGIGGRLDASNVVQPASTAVTPIELEHTDVLGPTLTSIAGEKAGIIKPGVPVFVSRQHPEAEDVLREKAREVGAPFYSFDDLYPEVEMEVCPEGTRIDFETGEGDGMSVTLGMPGGFQGENALLALAMVMQLTKPKREELEHILERFRFVSLPGRLERLGEHPPFILDGAHTPESVSRAIEAYKSSFDKTPICIFGSVYGKNAAGMAEILIPETKTILVSRPGTFKPNDPEELYTVFSSRVPEKTGGHPKIELIVEPERVFKRAVELSEGERPVLVIGSFYMVAEIRPLAAARAEGSVKRNSGGALPGGTYDAAR